MKLDSLELRRKYLKYKKNLEPLLYQHNLLCLSYNHNFIKKTKKYSLKVKRCQIEDKVYTYQISQVLVLNESDFTISSTLNSAKISDKENKCFEWIYHYIQYLQLKFLDNNNFALVKDKNKLEIHLYKAGKLLCIYKYINQPIGLQRLNCIVKDSHFPTQKLFLFFEKSVLTTEVRKWLNEHEGAIRYLVYEESSSHVFGMKHIKNNSIDFKLEIAEKVRYVDEDLIEYPFYYGKRQKNINCRLL